MPATDIKLLSLTERKRIRANYSKRSARVQLELEVPILRCWISRYGL